MGLSGAPFSNQLLLAVSLPVLPRIVGETGSGDAFVPGVIGGHQAGPFGHPGGSSGPWRLVGVEERINTSR